MQVLKDKVIFITGGSRGIGLECANKYKKAGARVVIISNDLKSLDKCRKDYPEPHHLILCDIAIASDVEHAIAETLNKYGRIDVIHNNAGIAHPSKPIHETTDEEWTALFNVNLKGVYHTTKFGIEALKVTQGCVLNTSSLVGEIGQEDHAAYAATKGAINALTKSMALDYAKYKIRVNAVAPAGVWTEMLEEWEKERQDNGGTRSYLDGIHALGYCPEGDVVADVCVFLVSEQARFITGVIMPVSGGAELGYRRIDQKKDNNEKINMTT